MRFSVHAAWTAFGGLSFAAVAIGCWVARADDVSAHVWLANLAAWLVGGGIALATSRMKSLRFWPAVALAGLACAFISPGMTGVHRWLGLGVVRLNGAELLLPPLTTSRLSLLIILAVLILLALQPDTSQAIAFAGASIVITAMSSTSRIQRVLTCALFAGAVMLSFLRPDPLQSVPEVEGIVGLATSMSPTIAALAVLSLAGTVLVPCVFTRSPSAYALTTYLAICALAPAFGAFPVPLVGMGVSPILGAWLGFGALMSVAGSTPARS